MAEDQNQENTYENVKIFLLFAIPITIIIIILLIYRSSAETSKPTPVSTPPVSTPPVSTPPVSTPPVSTPSAPELVTVYTDCYYKGDSASFLPGIYDVSKIKIPNDSLSSVKVPAGKSIKIFHHGVNSGNSITLTKDTPCLVSEGFNDTASAWVVS